MPTVAEYLKFANLQMAAEALYGFVAPKRRAEDPPPPVLKPGQPYSGVIDQVWLTDGNLHASRFARAEAAKFAAQWTVVEHISNTTTGFSGTLFKDRFTNELVLSFRSTEAVDDAVRDNEATNVLELKDKGFAFGQLSDMEGWYANLSKPGGPLAGKTFSVTGYSLGGHLATAFNLLHPGAAQQVITFNGAGIGRIGNGSLAVMTEQLPEMIDSFRDLRTDLGADTAAAARGKLVAGFLSDWGRQAYAAIRDALIPTAGIVSADPASLIDILDGLKGTEPLHSFEEQDYLLVKHAIEAAAQVAERVLYVANLKSGTDKEPPNPAAIPEAAIAAVRLDYQLAAFMTQRNFKTEALPIPAGLDAIFRKPTQAEGAPLSNQWDVAGEETSNGPNSALFIGGNWEQTTFSMFSKTRRRRHADAMAKPINDTIRTIAA